MLASVFKTFGILYLVMEQTIIPFDHSSIISQYFALDEEISIPNPLTAKNVSSDKVSAYNTKSDKEIKKISAQAIIHSRALVPSNEPEAYRVLPLITSYPEPTLPSITVIPTVEPTLIPQPTYKLPEVTIIPLPSFPPPCGCDPVIWKGKQIDCPMYVREVPCPALDY